MLTADTLQRISNYKTHQAQWERLASIRSRPRRVIKEGVGSENCYPISRQPICIHPEVEKLGEDVKRYILTQSFYKYMNDIANIEKDIINKAAYKVTKDLYFVKFSHNMKQDALSIIIDENYHAFVALDYMNQISERTQIAPLELPTETELSLAISDLKLLLPVELHDNFELITVCIAEHALTHDLIATSKSCDVSETFYNVMHDHVLDEGRHAIFFAELLDIFWGALPEESKQLIGSILPELLRRYLQSDMQRKFDEQILLHLNISQNIINNILDESHIAIDLATQKNSNIVLRQMLALLRKTKVLDHPATRAAFEAHHLL